MYPLNIEQDFDADAGTDINLKYLNIDRLKIKPFLKLTF